MDVRPLPSALDELGLVAVRALQAVYDLNASRFDDLAGDDAMTFGFNVYRNSWFRLEQDLEGSETWSTGRPDGSLSIWDEDHRVHVYRYGSDERADLDGFRLDDAGASATKQDIARVNGQLTLALEAANADPTKADLRELVIVHAGNPDDGCCGVWIGAPLPADQVVTSPWAWITPLWMIERAATDTPPIDVRDLPEPHDQLPEPDIEVTPVEDDESSTGEG